MKSFKAVVALPERFHFPMIVNNTQVFRLHSNSGQCQWISSRYWPKKCSSMSHLFSIVPEYKCMLYQLLSYKSRSALCESRLHSYPGFPPWVDNRRAWNTVACYATTDGDQLNNQRSQRGMTINLLGNQSPITRHLRVHLTYSGSLTRHTLIVYTRHGPACTRDSWYPCRQLRPNEQTLACVCHRAKQIPVTDDRTWTMDQEAVRTSHYTLTQTRLSNT